ncbi:MAG: glycosyltransferase [Bacteroidota bacterium]
MNKLVSIIIPVFNAEKFISVTLESVLAQSYQNWEAIVVDDGSTDSTSAVVKKYAQQDARIKYFFQNNTGCSGAKNAGMEYASGELIQYLDADDILSADKIEEQVAAIGNDMMKIAVCRTKVFAKSIHESDMAEIDTAFLFNTDDTLSFLLNLYGVNEKNGMIQPNAFLMSKKLADKAGPYNISISPSPDEDGEYFCRAILVATGILFTEAGINYYRKQTDSRSSLSNQVSHRHASGALRSLQLILHHLLHRENSLRVKKTMSLHFANFIYLYSGYTDLCKKAEDEIYRMGIKKIPVTGGRKLKRLAGLIGFSNAIKVKNLSSLLKK